MLLQAYRNRFGVSEKWLRLLSLQSCRIESFTDSLPKRGRMFIENVTA